MAYEFTKLSDVTTVNEVSDAANILIEENGEIKKVSKDEIGAQADWDETDETSPAFILNKPENIDAGTTWFFISDHFAYRGKTFDTTKGVSIQDIATAFDNGRVCFVFKDALSGGSYDAFSEMIYYVISASTEILCRYVNNTGIQMATLYPTAGTSTSTST